MSEARDVLAEIEKARRDDDGAFQRIVSRVFEMGLVTTRDLTRRFGISQSSVARWRLGRTAPHPAMRVHVYEQLAQWVRTRMGAAHGSLAWFVAEAMDLAGLPREAWPKTPREEQLRILRAWMAHVGTKVNFEKLAHFVDRIHVDPYAGPKMPSR